MSKTQVRARLLDALLADVVLPPLPMRDVTVAEEMVLAHNAAIRESLKNATCIEATNVAKFFDESYTDTETASQAFWADLKCLVPPHEKFFVEWENPHIPTAKRMGMFFQACKPELAEATARLILGKQAHSTPAKIAEFRQDPRCHWIYVTMDFLEFPHKNDGEHISGLRGPFHMGVLSVAEDGALIGFWMNHSSVLSNEESMQVGAASLVGATTLAMMNCANISTVEHRAPDAFQKARARSGKRPLVSYHTVRVDLDKTPRTIAAAGLPGDRATPRLHKRRGHIKDYRRGQGLFGRYKGVWYWGPELAGSAEEGVVVSDYEMTRKKA